MPIEIRLDLSGFERLMRRWGPDQIARRKRAAMDESLAYLRKRVQDATPVDTGLGRGSVFTEIRGTAVDLTGVVASAQPHMVVLEVGRRPGAKMPPATAIRRWLEHQGGDGRLAFVVARAIGRRGLPPHRMFARAAEQGRATVQAIWRRHFSA